MGYDKKVVKDLISTDQIFELLEEYGGEPEYAFEGNIISRTICHNHPNDDASRKLYYYTNSRLFHCYTGCAEPSFDVFQLIIKIADIQFHQEWDLDQAVRFLVYRLGIDVPREENEEDPVLLKQDFDYFDKINRVKELDIKNYTTLLNPYDEKILNRFNYNVKITPWINEGMNQETLDKYKIGFYPGTDVITIPHYDINNNFVGLRGRALVREDAEKYGKYRPVRIGKTLYNHPLGFNLYGLEKNKERIKLMQKAVVFEGEKSVLLFDSYFGSENNISVACCGSSFTIYQFYLLKNLGVKEIIIAFDKQYQQFGDAEHLHLVKNFYKILNRHINDVMVSFIFDGEQNLGYKDSPIDRGADTFMKLFQERRVFEGGVFK